MHILGRTNPSDRDFLTRKRFPDAPGPALYTGYDEPDSALEHFAATRLPPQRPPAGSLSFRPLRTGPDPSTPRLLHADFASALQAALPQDPELGPVAAAHQAASGAVAASGVVNTTKDRRIVVPSFCRTGCYIAVARMMIDSASLLRADCDSRF